MKKSTKRNLKKVLLTIIAVFPFLAVLGLVTNLIGGKTENEIHPNFEIGGLTATGEYEECKDTLYTPDAIAYTELNITRDFKSDVSYKLYFYDADDNFVSASEVYTKGSKHESEETQYVRIVVMPKFADDVKEEDRKIRLYEVRSIVKQLTFTSVNEVEEVELKTLTLESRKVDDVFEIAYEEGMTWAEWVGSKYNTYGFYVDGEWILIKLDYQGMETYFVIEECAIAGDPGIYVESSSLINSSSILNLCEMM